MKKLFLIIVLLMSSLVVASCNDNNEIAVEGIVISSAENVRTIKEGEKLQLTASVYPLTVSQLVNWSSSDETIATVDENGLVSAVSKGNVDIIATSVLSNDISQKFSIVVEEGEEVEVLPQSIEITADKTTCKVGEKINLSATVLPQEANQVVNWSSSDETIATVKRGEVTPLKEGSVVITATSKNNPEISSSISLTFEKSDDPVVNLEWVNMNYSTHEDYLTVDDQTPLKVKGVVTYVLPVNDNVVSYFIQNGNDGYYVYAQNNLSFTVELGKTYEVGGYKKYYRGLNEIVDVEYFVESTEAVNYNVNKIDELDTTNLDAMNVYQASYVSGQASFSNASINESKAYSFYAMVNGNSTTFRVDPNYMSAEEFKAINEKVSKGIEGLSFEFKGFMSAFGYGKPSPQILVVKASDLVFEEITTEALLKSAANSISIPSSIGFNVNTIELPTQIEGYEDIILTWSTETNLIDLSTGAVTHTSQNENVVLKATLKLGEEAYEVEFNVCIFALDDKVYEVVASLDLEDCGESDSYGNSVVKSNYKEAVVTIGTPAHNWLLRNALIASIANDKVDGLMAIRAKSGYTAEQTARIEIQEDGEYNVVEFDTAIYGSDASGAQIKIEYSLDSGSTWTASETIITLSNYELQTYRVVLPEGVKRVAIVVVEGTGSRVNFDNIKLMK